MASASVKVDCSGVAEAFEKLESEIGERHPPSWAMVRMLERQLGREQVARRNLEAAFVLMAEASNCVVVWHEDRPWLDYIETAHALARRIRQAMNGDRVAELEAELAEAKAKP